MSELMNDVKTELSDLKRDMDALRSDLGRLVGNLGRQAQTQLQETAQVAGKWANTAQGRAGELAKEARTQIEERPGVATAVAFGVGFALALLLVRRRD